MTLIELYKHDFIVWWMIILPVPSCVARHCGMKELNGLISVY